MFVGYSWMFVGVCGGWSARADFSVVHTSETFDRFSLLFLSLNVFVSFFAHFGWNYADAC